MWIKFAAFLCCVIATSTAADKHQIKKKDDVREKRNLEYSVSHHYPQTSNFRLERRIATGPQFPSYAPFFPGPKLYAPYRKGRPPAFPPPYAVQMEPLVHYSQRDPLYDGSALPLLTNTHNDLSGKPGDLITENNHVSESIYGGHQPVHKHYVERPVYIKEPEPIIEIIIRESNITLPTPAPPPPPGPKKKEPVQVFYVKYKKNPHGTGKDSIIYEKPIPAITPPVKDEPLFEETPKEHYALPLVTDPPPPSTTLRAIIKPDSETYHADSKIHITFGQHNVEHSKRSKTSDDVNEESAPEPAVSHPQARQFPSQPVLQRPITNVPNFQNGPPPNFRHESPRPPQSYRPFPQQPPRQFHNFESPFNGGHPPLPNRPPTQSFHQPFSPRPVPLQHNQQIPSFQQVDFNGPRRPVPYKPFDQVTPHQNQFQFPRPHTHFPIQQQLPQTSQRNVFNPQQPIHPQHRPPHQLVQQNFNQPQHSQQQHQQQFSNQFPSPQNDDAARQHFREQEFRQQQQPIIPPGGELIPSIPKYEQHISVVSNPSQPQALPLAQSQQPRNHLTVDEYNRQIQQQFKLPIQTVAQQLQSQNSQHQPQLQQDRTQQNNFNFHQQSQLQLQRPEEPKLQLQHQQSHLQQSHLQKPQLQSHLQQSQLEQSHLQEPQLQQSHSQQPQLQKSHLQQPYLQQQLHPSHLQQSHLQQSLSPQTQLHQQAFYKQNQDIVQSVHQTTQRPISYSTTPKFEYKSTTEYFTTTTKKAEKKPEVPKDNKSTSFQLPDEVPDELREQLLSSGILNNADISVLDYDKVGDIPISALPPDQLANFYGAGGAQQLAGSEPIPSIIKQNGEPFVGNLEEDQEMEGSEISEVKEPQAVEMKVVHYDPQTEQGQQVQESYVKEGATQVDPVVLNDQKYNRYLPLKVSGAQFPIPDVPELKGRSITSVVVLAPVDYTFEQSLRKTREAQPKKVEVNVKDVSGDIKDVRFLAGEALKTLLKEPTRENYKKWLERENNTASDKQAVVLLVTGPTNDTKEEREIFMYDVATETVSKLSGELSTAFVDAAETNAHEQDVDALAPAASNIIEDRVAYVDESEEHSKIDDSKIPIIDPLDGDLDTEASEQLETFVDISGMKIQPHEDLTLSGSNDNQVFISSGYSKTGLSLPST